MTDREPTDEELRDMERETALTACREVSPMTDEQKVVAFAAGRRALFNAGLAKGEARAREARLMAEHDRDFANESSGEAFSATWVAERMSRIVESLQPQEPKMADKQESVVMDLFTEQQARAAATQHGETLLARHIGELYASLSKSTETAEQLRARVGELEMALDLRGAQLATIRDMLGKGPVAHPVVTDESDPRWHPAIAATLSAMTRIAELEAEVARGKRCIEAIRSNGSSTGTVGQFFAATLNALDAYDAELESLQAAPKQDAPEPAEKCGRCKVAEAEAHAAGARAAEIYTKLMASERRLSDERAGVERALAHLRELDQSLRHERCEMWCDIMWRALAELRPTRPLTAEHPVSAAMRRGEGAWSEATGKCVCSHAPHVGCCGVIENKQTCLCQGHGSGKKTAAGLEEHDQGKEQELHGDVAPIRPQHANHPVRAEKSDANPRGVGVEIRVPAGDDAKPVRTAQVVADHPERLTREEHPVSAAMRRGEEALAKVLTQSEDPGMPLRRPLHVVWSGSKGYRCYVELDDARIDSEHYAPPAEVVMYVPAGAVYADNRDLRAQVDSAWAELRKHFRKPAPSLAVAIARWAERGLSTAAQPSGNSGELKPAAGGEEQEKRLLVVESFVRGWATFNSSNDGRFAILKLVEYLRAERERGTGGE